MGVGLLDVVIFKLTGKVNIDVPEDAIPKIPEVSLPKVSLGGGLRTTNDDAVDEVLAADTDVSADKETSSIFRVFSFSKNEEKHDELRGAEDNPEKTSVFVNLKRAIFSESTIEKDCNANDHDHAESESVTEEVVTNPVIEINDEAIGEAESSSVGDLIIVDSKDEIVISEEAIDEPESRNVFLRVCSSIRPNISPNKNEEHVISDEELHCSVGETAEQDTKTIFSTIKDSVITRLSFKKISHVEVADEIVLESTNGDDLNCSELSVIVEVSSEEDYEDMVGAESQSPVEAELTMQHMLISGDNSEAVAELSVENVQFTVGEDLSEITQETVSLSGSEGEIQVSIETQELFETVITEFEIVKCPSIKIKERSVIRENSEFEILVDPSEAEIELEIATNQTGDVTIAEEITGSVVAEIHSENATQRLEIIERRATASSSSSTDSAIEEQLNSGEILTTLDCVLMETHDISSSLEVLSTIISDENTSQSSDSGVTSDSNSNTESCCAKVDVEVAIEDNDFINIDLADGVIVNEYAEVDISSDSLPPTLGGKAKGKKKKGGCFCFRGKKDTEVYGQNVVSNEHAS